MLWICPSISLLARHSDIGSGGYDPAVTTEGAEVEFDGVEITAAVNGLDLTPGPTPISLDHVGITSARGLDPELSPETALITAVGAAAADCLARAVLVGVLAAQSVAGIPTYRDLLPGAFE